MTKSSIVALLTDFGTDDSYVAEMKGVMLSANPDLHLVDITHSISPGDIRHAAYLLWRSHSWFPEGTIFLSVVDPGVGSDRKMLLLQANGRIFVAPDNGLLTLVAGDHEYRAWEITGSTSISGRVSETFHGRDIMAPLCARISLSEVEPDNVGPCLQQLVKFEIAGLTIGESSIEGEIISIDRFGNAITNIPTERAAELTERAKTRVLVEGKSIGPIHGTFAEVIEGEPVAYFGSAGLVEIAINGGDFAREYVAKRGSRVRVVNDEE